MNWSGLSDPVNGGSDVTSYHVQYDGVSVGTLWTDIIGLSSDSLALTTAVTSSVQAGSAYRFRYRAKNLHGWGPYSDSLIIYAASVPSAIPSATLTNEGTLVKIAWTLPVSNGGLAIQGYRVFIEE